MKILVVEDDPSTLLIFNMLLGRLGHTVVSTDNAEEALALLESHSELRLVFVDWQLPSLNGLDFAKKVLCGPYGDSIFVVLTTYAPDPDAIQTAFSLGVHDFLPKPIEAPHLWSRLKAAERALDPQGELGAEGLRALNRHSNHYLLTKLIHEVATPLSVVKWSAQLLSALKEPVSRNDLHTWGTKIVTSVHKTLAILKNERTRLSESREKNRQMVNLRLVIEEAADAVQPQLGEITLKILNDSADMMAVQGNDVELFQVFVNLLSNSCDAIKANKAAWIRLDCATVDGWHQVVVHDSGRAPWLDGRDILGTDLGRTTKGREHYALGLRLSRMLLEEHGGTIMMDPQSETTRLIVRLPKVTH